MGLRRPVASPSSNGRLWFRRGQLSSAHLLHLQRSGWQWLKQCGLGFAEIEPAAPILALKDDHLAIMDRRNVRARSRGQQGEGGSAVGHRSPEPGEAKPVFSSLRELPFRLRRLLASELKEVRRGHEATSDRKAPSLRTEINDWRSLRLCRREAPTQDRELERAILQASDNRSRFGWPNVVSRLQVRSGGRPSDGNASFAKRREIVAVGNEVAEVIAHGHDYDAG